MIPKRLAVAPAILALAGCPSLPDPEPPKPPVFDPADQATCKVRRSESKPLIIEWPAPERGSLETQARRGTVVVRYDGCEMQVLHRCQAPGSYGYSAFTPKRDSLSIQNEDQLYASMPIGAASLEAKLAQAGQLDVQMTLVGTFVAERDRVRAQELTGSCEGATHVVYSLTVGAFIFSAGSSSEAGGGVAVLGAGAGGKTTARREVLASDGEQVACAKSSTRDAAPPEGCSALLRLEVIPLEGGSPPAAAAGPATAAKATPIGAAPSSPTPAGAPSGGPDAMLVLFARAANSRSYELDDYFTAACRAGECTGFKEQVGTKFRIHVGKAEVKGSHAIAEVEVLVEDHVGDRLFLHLLHTSNGWLVQDMAEERAKATRWLESPAETAAIAAHPRLTPQGATDAALRELKAGRHDGWLAFFTQEAQARESSWDRSFTFATKNKGLKLKDYRHRDTTVNGDGAEVTYKAVFTLPDGKEDGESLTFVLLRQKGDWWIIELK